MKTPPKQHKYKKEIDLWGTFRARFRLTLTGHRDIIAGRFVATTELTVMQYIMQVGNGKS
jgi:hypothetical protein